MKIPASIVARAAALRPHTLDGGTTDAFQSMAGGQRVYENHDYTSPPDYSEALRRYNKALGLSKKD
jgi:hypothetical protein